MKRRVTLLLLATLPAVPVAAAPDPVQTALGGEPNLSTPGCALGVFRDGRLVRFASSGAADMASGRLMNADTQFYAASVSKQFTALAAMQLVAQGKLKLDADIRTYLPELPDYGRKITPAMLLNHTAGIRDSLELLSFAGHSDVAAATREQALALTLAQTATKFEPGSRYDYSNGGYLLLAEIIQRLSGEPFAAYVNRAVLKPMGMTRSFIMDGARSRDPNIAHGTATSDGKRQAADSYPLFGGSGGLITTINDLAKYDRDIDSGHKVWTPAVRKLMLEPGRLNDGSAVRPAERSYQSYASGVIVGPDWFWHTGGARGFKTIYARLPAKRLGMALLCNDGDIVPNVQLNGIVAAMNEGLPPVVAPPGGALADGAYRSPDLPVIYNVQREGDGLKLTVSPADDMTKVLSTLVLKPQADGFVGPGVKLAPDADGAGFALQGGRVSLNFRKTGS
ncbi:beta-lactamase family protein [Sandaracinobacter neustonicus]|uniref:Beta-lactamase family protein n=1 Tax=Sandaracinobacter neustonicus TaxID=1715348 RepID=A0A501XTB4_9SPHN|nr:serine hydrolase domain-containing protein [Sandaracinobacter neustonicus]TPE63613.1 beta-lactamase family protein [Sandaracinobacter neustonicus]